MAPETNIADRFVAQYGALKGTLPGAGLGWLERLRDQALDRFTATGVPTQRVEAWKYTSLAPLARLPLVAAAPVENGLVKSRVPWLLPAKAKAHRLVFVNGWLRPDLSTPGKLPSGIKLIGLAASLAEVPQLLEGRLGAAAPLERQPMFALNTALAADGFVLHLAKGAVVERPIELLFVALPGSEPVAYHPHGLILAESGSSAEVIERHVGLGRGTYFANVACEIALEADAALRHYRHVAEGSDGFHIATNNVTVGRDSRYEGFTLSTGGRLTRNEVRVVLDGTGANCRLDGAYLGRGRQHIDNTTVIDHAKPHTTSRELFKGVLDGQSRGVFQGQILVRPDAQKSDGQQTHRALLLSEAAEIDTKPQLEIYADDVKCSHGAAAGALDRDALFYLRSRGIPEPDARRMLVEAFLADAVDGIASEPVREAFRRTLAELTGAGR
jgi:Fe-S cluster assembly protein SufD